MKRRKVTVSTRDYERSHMRSPRGRGSWAFSFYREGERMTVKEVRRDRDGFEFTENSDYWFSPSCTYMEARKLAIAKAREMGADHIEVMS